jgi:quinol monooxygenase YgiN
MIAELTIKPDQLAAFLAYTTAILHFSRSYPGHIAFDRLQDQNDPNRILFYEVWETPAG